MPPYTIYLAILMQQENTKLFVKAIQMIFIDFRFHMVFFCFCLFVCLFVCLFFVFCLGDYRPTREFFTHMETSPLTVKDAHFDLCSALMAIEQ